MARDCYVAVVDKDRRLACDRIEGVATLRWLRANHVRHHATELLAPVSHQRVSLVAGDGDSNLDSNMGARRLRW